MEHLSDVIPVAVDLIFLNKSRAHFILICDKQIFFLQK